MVGNAMRRRVGVVNGPGDVAAAAADRASTVEVAKGVGMAAPDCRVCRLES